MAKPNFANRTLWTGDNLDIMRNINSECIDLIYLDPPFNSNRNYSAPVGSKAAGAAFKDIWTLDDVKLAWLDEIEYLHPAIFALANAAGITHGPNMKAYLLCMGIRLIQMKRILKPSGSVYLHCDPTSGHYLKVLMDAVFGKGSFRNDIAWCYTGPSNTTRWFPRKHDSILFYASSSKTPFWPNRIRVPYKKLNTGKTQGIFKHAATLKTRGKVPEDWWTEFSPVGRLANERIGYPTQKPLALLERIILASTRKGQLVFDPFCGCATSLVAAERWGRQWAGIDLSALSIKLVRRRIKEDNPLFNSKLILHSNTADFALAAQADTPEPADYRQYKHDLYGKQSGECAGCKEHFQLRNLTIDHIVPRSRGGTHIRTNLQLLCQACNSTKGTGTQQELKAKLKQQGIL